MSAQPSPSLLTRRRWMLIANSMLLGVSLFFALLLLYKVAKDGQKVSPPVVFISAVLALGFAWAMTFSLEKKVRVCLASFSSGFALIALDLYILAFPPHFGSFSEPLLLKDPNEKLAVLSDLRRSQPAYPGVSPYLLVPSNGLASATGRIFPLAGISQMMTVLSKESGFWKCDVSDEHGFNNPLGSHSTNAGPIVLIGDSFLHGASVKDGDDIAGQMRRLDQTAVNLGIWGHGPLLELATLTEYGIRLRPRTVFWIYFEGNDLVELVDEKEARMLTSYLDEGYSQHLADHQVLIDSLLKQYCDSEEQKLKMPRDKRPSGTVSEAQQGGLSQRIWGSQFVRVLRLRHLRSGVIDWRRQKERRTVGWDKDRVKEDDLTLFQQTLTVAAQRVKQSGAEFYFVYLPDQTRFNQKLSRSPVWRERAKVMSIVETLNLPRLDLSEEFARHPDPLSLYISRSFYSHFNQAGNEFVARACLERLKAGGM